MTRTRVGNISLLSFTLPSFSFSGHTLNFYLGVGGGDFFFNYKFKELLGYIIQDENGQLGIYLYYVIGFFYIEKSD